MVRYRRNFVPGGSYFFTVTLADRSSDILTARIGTLRAAIDKARADRPFGIDAIVVLPEHLHTIFTLPAGDADYPHRWRRIKAAFTHGLRRDGMHLAPTANGGFDLWQPRYWEHTIRDDADYARHVDYIHFNPVKHGHVASATAWPFSSLHRFIRQGILPQDWGAVVEEDEMNFGERGSPHEA